MTPLPMHNLQIQIGGDAGQGIVKTSIVLATGATLAGYHVCQSARHGVAVRGGQVTADVIISTSPIDYPKIEQPNFVLAFSQSIFDSTLKNHPRTQLIFDPYRINATSTHKTIHPIEAARHALSLQGTLISANMIMLGYFLQRFTHHLVTHTQTALSIDGDDYPNKLLQEAFSAGQKLALQTPSAP